MVVSRRFVSFPVWAPQYWKDIFGFKDNKSVPQNLATKKRKQSFS